MTHKLSEGERHPGSITHSAAFTASEV